MIVRTVAHRGAVWYVLGDVCRILGAPHHHGLSALSAANQPVEYALLVDPDGRSGHTGIISLAGFYTLLNAIITPEAAQLRARMLAAAVGA